MSTPAKKPPKGGKLGGAVFPRMDLSEGVDCAKRLVSKTHTAAQPLDVMYSGVVRAKHGRGGEKVSALKQYGFLLGSTKDGFTASPSAKELVSAPEPERAPHLKKAALKPKIFKALFDTFLGDAVSKGKLKQRAAELRVHPEMQDLCIEMYTKSLSLAGLVSIDGDQVAHVQGVDVPLEVKAGDADEGQAEDAEDSQGASIDGDDAGQADAAATAAQLTSKGDQQKNVRVGGAARAVIQVNITLDSSLDTDKLAKQLELLKKFGAL